MDYAIQKATELGVVHITPLLTAFSEVRLEGKRLQNRLQHWQRVCISACEQSGRSRIPTIDEPQPLNAWVEANRDGLILDGSGGDSLSTFDVVSDSVCLLVGPEGGFEEREIQSARDQGYRCIRLGPRVLRTETAPVVGLALLQYLYGDLGER
jgi:16S rRNA (uracil1498-N3)-methyltransferase